MPQTLYSFFQSEGVKNPAGGSNLAGFIDRRVFKYYDSSNLLAPATVNALEAKAKTSKATVYTNREETLWIKHYPRIKVKFMDALKSTEGDGSVMVTCAGVNPTSTIQAVALHVADGMIRRRA